MCNENHKIFNKNIYYVFQRRWRHKLVVFSVLAKSLSCVPSQGLGLTGELFAVALPPYTHSYIGIRGRELDLCSKLDITFVQADFFSSSSIFLLLHLIFRLYVWFIFM